MTEKDLDNFIKKALEEDLGSGDITTDCLIPPGLQAEARIIAKQNLVLAGCNVAERLFNHLDKNCKWVADKKDGDKVKKGEVFATITGRAASILKGERTALNFLQHLSGIATLTKAFVDAVKGRKTKILDTRKTLPGLRALEKQAVLTGGGESHRMGLFDRYLIKNNHIDLVGSLSKAVEKVLANRKNGVLVEVEVRNFEELKMALRYPIDIILLDNFDPDQVHGAVKHVKGKVKLEVSGGVNMENVAQYAATGVDFISIGALTHSAPAADLHLII